MFWSDRRSRYPTLRRALNGDVRAFAVGRGRPIGPSSTEAVFEAVRLALVSDAFLALVFYRARCRLLSARIPIMPHLLHRCSILLAQVSIGDPVIVQPGLNLPHGQVVIDGITEIGANVLIRPWVTIGLTEGSYLGPTIEHGVSIGTGAKVLGAITIGSRAKIGANAVVLNSVAPGVTAVGVPARVVSSRDDAR